MEIEQLILLFVVMSVMFTNITILSVTALCKNMATS